MKDGDLYSSQILIILLILWTFQLPIHTHISSRGYFTSNGFRGFNIWGGENPLNSLHFLIFNLINNLFSLPSILNSLPFLIPLCFLRRAGTFYEMLFIPTNCFACVGWDHPYQLLLEIIGKVLIWYVLVLAFQQSAISSNNFIN